MSRQDPGEIEYYDIVLDYLKSQGCATFSYDQYGKKIFFKSRGSGKLIVDVYGLKADKDIFSRRVEGIAVEVKRAETHTSLRYIAQAAQYSRFAHRCYLAQPRRDFDSETKVEAARHGVGLLVIGKSKVKVVAESNLFSPYPETFQFFLNHSLRIDRCAVCGCFRFRHKNIVASNSTGGHWRLDHLVSGKPTGKKNKKFFLCEDCERHWASASEESKIATRLARFEKRIKKMDLTIKKLKLRK